jgi:GPH family glycoside/pentoside/hexuronide:cation symporter
MKLFKKLEYSFGAVATALSYQAFSTYIIFFYVDVVKLPAYLAAIGMLVYAVWNAVNDPIAGYISDHTRTRWGRRIPYIALGAIPFGIIYFLLWTPPFTEFSQVLWLFIYFVVFICLFDGFYTVTILNWASLFPEMFSSLAERSEVNAYRQSFAMLGLVLGIAIPPLIYGTLGWGWMGAIFGVIIAGALLVALRGSHEEMVFSHEKQLPLIKSFKATLENRSFLIFVFANLFVQYTFTIILATIPFFAKYILDVGAPGTAAILAAAFLTAFPMLYIWRKLTIRFGAKKCFMATMLSLAVSLTPFFLVKSFLGAVFSSMLVGCGLAGFILIADIILSDVIDEDETKTGTRREGMYFGANAFVTRFAIVLEALSMGAVFVITQYNPYIYTQTRQFLSGLRLLVAGFPVMALLLAFLIMVFYPLSGRRLEELREKISEIHAKKGVTES